MHHKSQIKTIANSHQPSQPPFSPSITPPREIVKRSQQKMHAQNNKQTSSSIIYRPAPDHVPTNGKKRQLTKINTK